MDVYFRSAATNTFSTNLSNGQQVIFKQGIYSTTDKDVVRELLRTDALKRRLVKLESDEKAVAKWLDSNEEPSYITPEYLDGLSNECLMVLANKLNTTSRVPTIVKEELVGEPLTDDVVEIVNAYRTEEVTAEPVEEADGHLDEMITKAIANGTITRQGVWYKTSDGKSLGRDKQEVIDWLKQAVEG